MASDDRQSPQHDKIDSLQASPPRNLVKTIHYLVLALFVAGGIAYWVLRPPTLNPATDLKAAEAMALVQTHRAQRAPTILQAVTDHVQAMKARGQGVWLGTWTVTHERGDLYQITIIVREEGTRQWFEREYIWRVNLAQHKVEPVSLLAEGLMPLQPAGQSPLIPKSGRSS